MLVPSPPHWHFEHRYCVSILIKTTVTSMRAHLTVLLCLTWEQGPVLCASLEPSRRKSVCSLDTGNEFLALPPFFKKNLRTRIFSYSKPQWQPSQLWREQDYPMEFHVKNPCKKAKCPFPGIYPVTVTYSIIIQIYKRNSFAAERMKNRCKYLHKHTQ